MHIKLINYIKQNKKQKKQKLFQLQTPTTNTLEPTYNDII